MTSQRNPSNDAYAEAGVSIAAGNALVDRIKPLAKATARAGALGSLGGFGAVFDIKALGMHDPLLISTTDGVGTKLKLATEMGVHDTIGIDLVAMCVNDLVVAGAEPLYFLDYFACGALDVAQATSVIAGIAEGCRQAGCALTGGETAEMPGMYTRGEYDLAGFAVGAVERDALLPRDVTAGDVLLGLASSGVHSNGYSLVRKILADGEFSLSQPSPFESRITTRREALANHDSLGHALLTPTRIYVKSTLAAIRAGGVHALAHITGGGLTENLPRVLPDSLAAHIIQSAWEMPPVFAWLSERGRIERDIMLRTFNCGIGMVLVVAADRADALTATLTEAGETVHRIGHLAPRAGEAVVYT